MEKKNLKKKIRGPAKLLFFIFAFVLSISFWEGERYYADVSGACGSHPVGHAWETPSACSTCGGDHKISTSCSTCGGDGKTSMFTCKDRCASVAAKKGGKCPICGQTQNTAVNITCVICSGSGSSGSTTCTRCYSNGTNTRCGNASWSGCGKGSYDNWGDYPNGTCYYGEHVATGIYYDANNHWNCCAYCGGSMNTAGHSYGAEYVEGNYRYRNCGCGYRICTGGILHNVNYNANGGTGAPGDVHTKEYGHVVTLSSVKPTRTGYTFTGWNSAPNGSGFSVASGGQYGHDQNGGTVTMYAQWTANQYSLTVNPNGGKFNNSTATQTLSPNLVYDASNHYVLSVPVRTGYTFLGWYSGNTMVYNASGYCVNGTFWTNNIYKYTGNLSVTAKWQANVYTITSDPANGNGAWATNITFDQKYGASALPVLTRHGYDFLGWYNPNGTKVDANTTMQWAGNHTVTARWKVHQHYVYYNLNGGEKLNGSSKILHDYGSAINLSQTATREYYTFTGWSLSPGIGQVIPKMTLPDNAVTLYAQWTLEVSDLQQAMLCVWHKDDPMTLVRLDIPATSRRLDGSTFVTNGLNVLASYGGANHSTSNIYVYLYDNAGNYTPWKLQYAGGDNAPNPLPLFYQQTTRHMFYHAANEMYETVYSVTELAQENKTYTPKALPVTVNGTTYSMPAGYAASYEITNPEGAAGGYTVTKDAITEVRYQPLSYRLTFDAAGGIFEDGKGTAEKTVQYTDYYGELPVPEKEGYTFTGWYKDSSCTGDSVYSSMVYETPDNTTLYAGWEANTYYVTYNYEQNGGETFDGMSTSIEIPVKFGSAVSLSPTSSKPDFVFNGWSTDPFAEKGLESFTMPAENVTLYALFYKECVITLVDEAGTRNVTGIMYNDAENVQVEYPAIREKDGWEPVEWTSVSGLALDATGGKTYISKSETYYASYDRVVTAGFVVPDDMPPVDAVEDTVHYTTGSAQTSYTVELPVPVERPGYSFVGWESSDGQWFDLKDKPSGSDWEGIFTDSVTITGKWDRHPSIIVYDRYYTLEDAVNGNITIDSLLESVTAEDEEDGILTKENGLSIPDYNPDEFRYLASNASVTVTYKAVDSFGNEVTKSVVVHIVDADAGETEITKTARFIEDDCLYATDASEDADGDGFLDGRGNEENLGGLYATSLWKTNAQYLNALDGALQGRETKEATTERTYTFTPSEIKEAKDYVETHGYADFIENNGRENFISAFLSN